MSFDGTPKRRLSKDDKDLLKFVKNLSMEEAEDVPQAEEGEEEEDVPEEESSSSEEDDEKPIESPPPPPPQEMNVSVGEIASKLDEDWEVMSNPVSPSAASAQPTSPSAKLDFDTIMKNAELARRSSYSERNQGEELVHEIRGTLHYEGDDSNEPPSAKKRGLVSRKFDHDSPNFIGLKCWADRWMVVENDELRYFLRKSDEDEGKPPISSLKLMGCNAVAGTGPDVPKVGEYGDENYMPAVVSNGLDKDMFRVHTKDGPITHRCSIESEAAVWARIFNYSPALKSPSLKETKKIRASFSQRQTQEDLDELRRLAAEEDARVAAQSEGGEATENE